MRTAAVWVAVLALVAACACLARPAQERRNPIDVRLEKALDKDPSTAGQRRAIHAAEAEWDAAMNRAYTRLMAELEPRQQEALRKSQRAWLAFRDAEFEANARIVGGKQGTMWLVTLDEKRMELVKQRTLWLEDYRRILDE